MPVERKWTDDQARAISARGGSLLVSAAAGSGKTAVLVERVVRRIADPDDPVDADRLLVVTFSRAAASEMRERIASRLARMIQDSPGNARLVRQQALLSSASISTVHAFCQQLVREHFQQLSIAPDFRICEEKELMLLRDEVVRDTLETCYREDDERFPRLVELLSSGLDDRNLSRTIFSIYDFMRSHPFCDDWLDSRLRFYDGCTAPGESVWGGVILPYAGDSIRYACTLTQEALDIIAGDEAMEKAYLTAFWSDKSSLEEIRDALASGQWDTARGILKRFEFTKLGMLRGYGDSPEKAQVQERRSRVKKIVERLAQRILCVSAEEFQDDITALRPLIDKLFELVKRFSAALDEYKQARRIVDFADLEQLAIRLLVERDKEGYRPSPLAKEISSRYAEIMVDEYQDTNEAQDLIFRTLSNREENLFMVGDVKQSIYRFRQAMPEIFLKKKDAFAPYDGLPFPAKIILGHNFRSRKEVTEGINFIFRALMSRDVGELDYTGEEALVPAAEYPESSGAGVLFELVDTTGEGEPEAAEPRHVAREIARLLESGSPVTENGKLRPIRPGDICILLRSVKNRADLYVQALSQEGIPGFSRIRTGFFSTLEVSSVVSLLRAVDNPLADISMVAAMMSPIFSFTADEITAIRLVDRRIPLYLCVVRKGEEGDARCAEFLDTLGAIRRYAAIATAQRLIRKILEITGFENTVSAMRLGRQRVANLRLLVQYAAGYEKAGYNGLSGFVRFVDALEQRGDDLAPAVDTQVSDAVQVMSIHASKGLEYPVVFLCDTGRRFNMEDLRKSTLLHSRYGFACVRRDPVLRKQFTTLPMEALKLAIEQSTLSEEMRILYVALTRARERLVITASRKEPYKWVRNQARQARSGRLPHYAVREAAGFAEWLMMALLNHPDSRALREEAGVRLITVPRPDSRFSVRIAGLSGTERLQEPAEALAQAAYDPAELERIRAAVSAVYPYRDAVEAPAKLAVTAIVGKEEQEEYRFSSRPLFTMVTSLTAAEQGNALHQYMLYAHHGQAVRDLSGELDRLVREGFLTGLQAKSINRARLARFYHTRLFRRMEDALWIYREFPLMTELGREELGRIYPNLGENRVVVQGIADVVFEETGGLVIVDYKTDRVAEPGILLERYRQQLELYASIVEHMLEKPVKEKIIYSVELAIDIAVETREEQRPGVPEPSFV